MMLGSSGGQGSSAQRGKTLARHGQQLPIGTREWEVTLAGSALQFESREIKCLSRQGTLKIPEASKLVKLQSLFCTRSLADQLGLRTQHPRFPDLLCGDTNAIRGWDAAAG